MVKYETLEDIRLHEAMSFPWFLGFLVFVSKFRYLVPFIARSQDGGTAGS